MGKLIVIDDEGNQEEFSQFIAVGIQEGGVAINFIEDEGLGGNEKMALLLSGLAVLSELGAALVGSEPEGKET